MDARLLDGTMVCAVGRMTMIEISTSKWFVRVEFDGWSVTKYVGCQCEELIGVQIRVANTPAIYSIESGRAYYIGLAWAICRLAEPLHEFVQGIADLERIRVVQNLAKYDKPWAKEVGRFLEIYVAKEEA